MQTIILLYFIIEDHDTLFVMAEAVHLAGIGILAYKLLRKKNCGGACALLHANYRIIPISAFP